jgi:hypothetical protein
VYPFLVNMLVGAFSKGRTVTVFEQRVLLLSNQQVETVIFFP